MCEVDAPDLKQDSVANSTPGPCSNQIPGVLQDLNLTGFETSYSYDALERLLTVSYSDGTTPGLSYAYDQSQNWTQTLTNSIGRRTAAYVNGTGLGTPPVNFVTGRIWSYDALGRVASSSECVPSICGAGGWTRTEIAAGGRALGSYNPQTGGTTLTIADELGTVRARTDLAGNVQERYTSLPFGDLLTTWNDNWQPTNPAVGAISPLHFTGQPRDAETGLDDFGARLYSSRLGRWMTPDWSEEPENIPFADLRNPQSLNLYAYVLNNRVSEDDPDGHMRCTSGTSSDG